jgi:hypothetical protein
VAMVDILDYGSDHDNVDGCSYCQMIEDVI